MLEHDHEHERPSHPSWPEMACPWKTGGGDVWYTEFVDGAWIARSAGPATMAWQSDPRYEKIKVAEPTKVGKARDDPGAAYLCLFCSELVCTGQPALCCTHCACNPFHLECVRGSDSETACPQCFRAIIVPFASAFCGSGAQSTAADETGHGEKALSDFISALNDIICQQCEMLDEIKLALATQRSPEVLEQLRLAKANLIVVILCTRHFCS